MSANKIIGGDYEGYKIIGMFGKVNIYTDSGDSIILDSGNVQKIEILTEENTKKVLGAAGLGIVGGMLLGPLGLLVGALAGGNRKEICFICYLRDGTKFVAITDVKIYQLISVLVINANPIEDLPQNTNGETLTNMGNKCEKCNTEIDINVKFCPECGERNISKIRCRKCNNEIDKKAKFCGECGEKTITEATCSEETKVNTTNLQKRDGLFYLINKNTPYTGGFIAHWENGKIRQDGYLLNGKIEGEFISYYENGELQRIVKYRNGKAVDLIEGKIYFSELENCNGVYCLNQTPYTGGFLNYWGNGQIREDGYFLNGKLEGEYISYSEHGEINKKLIYKEGKSANKKRWLFL